MDFTPIATKQCLFYPQLFSVSEEDEDFQFWMFVILRRIQIYKTNSKQQANEEENIFFVCLR